MRFLVASFLEMTWRTKAPPKEELPPKREAGMIGEVFYSEAPFKARTVAYLESLADAEKGEALRKADGVGYYLGEVHGEEVAFANLPTPQLKIANYEELTLSIFLPKVTQLEAQGKQIGVLVSLADKDGKAYSEKGLDRIDTAIYSTFPLGSAPVGLAGPDAAGMPVVQKQEVTSGQTYIMTLDTVQKCGPSDMQRDLDPVAAAAPRDVFENWAKRSDAFGSEGNGTFLLGDNTTLTVTVYCLYKEDDERYTANADYPVDPTYMPRSASVTFNGWFNNYTSKWEANEKTGVLEEKDMTVEIACGRHLQNLGKLTELREKLRKYAPTATDDDGDGIYTYADYNYGMADVYTTGSSSIADIEEDDPDYKTDRDPNVYYEEITEKYVYRTDVKPISIARQTNSIDFDCAEWRDGADPIPFTPINLAYGFYYYGNYLTINHLYVDAPFYAGLFGYIYHPHLYDILLVDPSVTSQMPAHLAEIFEMGVGGLVGTSRDSSHINNCQVYMTPQEDGTYDYAKYRVTGECYVGGLIGFCEDENIMNCSASVGTGYAQGAKGSDGASLSSRYVGGLIGCITGDSSISNCYAAGILSGEYVGGLVGYVMEDSDPSGDDYRIDTCYTAGHIEYASVEAAGIVGRIHELAGNAKSAVSVYGNYCVIIYGTRPAGGGDYAWNSGAPIYGTFKGDGVEWLHTRTEGLYDVYLKDKFAGKTYFAGAVFENDNKNYFIKQRGITYATRTGTEDEEDSYSTLKSEAEDLFGLRGLTGGALTAKLEEAQGKVFWIEKLRALDELKQLMEELVEEIENETATGADGKAYNLAGNIIWVSRARAEVTSSKAGDEDKPIQLSLVEAVHLMYDGNYTDLDGVKHTNEKITYEGSNKAKDGWLNTKSGIETYTFMGFYNALKKAFTTLAGDPDNADALTMVHRILGDDSGDLSWVETSGSSSWTRYFYEKGLFHTIFYSELLYDAIDKSKDYYERPDVNDKNGEVFYRHLRSDYLESRFLSLVCDLAMSQTRRNEFLFDAQKNELSKDLEEAIGQGKTTKGKLDDYLDIIDKWSSETMTAQKSTAKTLVNATIAALEDLQTALNSTDKKPILSYGEKAYDAMYELWQFFETYKNTEDVIDLKGNKGQLRKLRDPIEDDYLKMTLLSMTRLSGGIAGALDVLAIRLEEDGSKSAQWLAEFEAEVKVCLESDSGNVLTGSTAAQRLREAAIELQGELSDEINYSTTNDPGFMYDYNAHYSGQDRNPYENAFGKGNNAYVDADNKVYNNVFPYTEGTYTKFYPFPFVFGRKVEKESGSFHPAFILFHYGDWLTQDLWAE